MCGRYSVTLPHEQMRRVFKVVGPLSGLAPRYNVAPGQDIPAIRLEGGERRLAVLRWGFPASSPEAAPSRMLINARGETIDRKPTFREAFRLRRCLVPANGFYEWRPVGRGPKQPYYVRPREAEAFAMAGLWERGTGPGGQPLDFVTIVTCNANALLKPIHERMPAVLEPADWDAWLNTSATEPDAAKALIRPVREDFFEAYPISTAVNRAANEGAELIRPLARIVGGRGGGQMKLL
jgi:putative SOS response-associated peptidase YedK